MNALKGKRRAIKNGFGPNCRWEQETYQARVRISEGSDGLIPLSSQRMDNMSDLDVYDAKGVNHLEVGNHPRMTEIFNQIFDRNEPAFSRGTNQ